MIVFYYRLSVLWKVGLVLLLTVGLMLVLAIGIVLLTDANTYDCRWTVLVNSLFGLTLHWKESHLKKSQKKT